MQEGALACCGEFRWNAIDETALASCMIWTFVYGRSYHHLLAQYVSRPDWQRTTLVDLPSNLSWMYNQMLQMQFTPPPQAAPSPNKMNEMAERPLVQCSPEYLAQLMKDKTSYTMVSSMFVHIERLLDDGKFANFTCVHGLCGGVSVAALVYVVCVCVCVLKP